MGREDAEKFVETLKKVFEGVATFNAEIIDIEADSLEEGFEKIKNQVKSKRIDKCECLDCKINRIVDAEIEKEIILKGPIFKHCEEWFKDEKNEAMSKLSEFKMTLKIELNDAIMQYTRTSMMLHLHEESKEKKK